MNDLKKEIINASKWSALAEISGKLIQPLVYIILARLLTPEDFGVVTIATMVTSFSQILWDTGLNKALIQRQKDTNKAANIVFWTNFIAGIAIYAVIFIFADSIAKLFNDIRAENVIKIQGIGIIIISIGTVQTAMFQKILDFKRLFYVRLTTTAIPGFISIPLALSDFGYWSLVAGALVGNLAQIFTLWKLSSWKPRFQYDLILAKEIIPFGLWVSGEGILVWFFVWIDSIIVGKYLGIFELGLYKTSNTIVSLLFVVTLGAIIPVLYSSLSKLNNDITKLNIFFLKAVKTITFIALPIGFGLFFVSEPFANIVLGQKWRGADFVIGIFSILHSVSWIVGANPELYKAIGKPKIGTQISLISLPIYICVYLFFINKGLEMFLYARLGLGLFMLPIHMFIAQKFASIPILAIFKNIKFIVLSIIQMSILLYLINRYFPIKDDITKLSVLVFAGVTSYSFIFFWEKQYVHSLFELVINRKTL